MELIMGLLALAAAIGGFIIGVIIAIINACKDNKENNQV